MDVAAKHDVSGATGSVAPRISKLGHILGVKGSSDGKIIPNSAHILEERDSSDGKLVPTSGPILEVTGLINARTSGTGSGAPLESKQFTRDLVRFITNGLSANIGNIAKDKLTAVLYKNVDEEGEFFHLVYPYVRLSNRDVDTLYEYLKDNVGSTSFADKSADIRFDVNDETIFDDSTAAVIPHIGSLDMEYKSEPLSAIPMAPNASIFDGAVDKDGKSAARQYTFRTIPKPEGNGEKKRPLPGRNNPNGIKSGNKDEDEDMSQLMNGLVFRLQNSIKDQKHLEYEDRKAILHELLEIADEGGLLDDMAVYRTIGEICYNVYKGTNEGLVLWENIAAQHGVTLTDSKYAYRWMSATYTTNASLMEMLSESDTTKDAYLMWMGKRIVRQLDSIRAGSTFIMAVIFHMIRPIDFITDYSSGQWYSYSAGVWGKENRRNAIHNVSVNDVHSVVQQFYYNKLEYGEFADDKETAKWKKSFGEVLSKFQSDGGIKAISTELEHIVAVPALEKKINKRYHTFQAANGVIEFIEDTKEVIFRPHRREDYATIKSNVEYDPSYTLNHPDVQFCLDYYSMVFPDRDTMECRLRYVGSKFYRMNHNKVFVECLGTHNNSKTMETWIQSAILGAFHVNGKMELLTTKPQEASGPDTSKNGMEDVCAVTFSEAPPGSIMWNTGFIKQVTGGDECRIRRMREEERDALITAKIDIVSNFPVDAAPGDDAMEGRRIDFPYRSVWSRSAPSDPAEQRRTNHYKLDADFRRKLRDKLPAFFWLYIYYAKKWFVEGKDLKLSDEVVRYTEENTRKNDFYTPFIESQFKKSDDARVEYTAFVKNADDAFSKTKFAQLYRSDVLEKYLKKWLGGADYIQVEDGKKYIVGIEYTLQSGE